MYTHDTGYKHMCIVLEELGDCAIVLKELILNEFIWFISIVFYYKIVLWYHQNVKE